MLPVNTGRFTTLELDGGISTRRVSFPWNSDVRGIGYDISWGIPKMIPVSYRQHKGETNYTKYYDNSFSGTERREGAEWTLGWLFNFSGTKFTSGETSQTTNKITIGTDMGLHISYENDYLFNMSMPGVPKADDGDRWRTAAVEIGGAFLKLNLNMFTGDPDTYKIGDRYDYVKEIDGRETYTGGTADKYRAGVLSLSIGPLRIGRNSEQIRKVFQNQFAHDMLTGGEAKWFRVLDKKPRWYWYFGTGTGNTLW